MISKEVAKKLKDGGFPQLWKPKWTDSRLSRIFNDVFSVYEPTLSELIQECAKKISGFRLCCNFRVNEYGVQTEGQGLEQVKWHPSPEEAVAEFYIKLNSK
jgi:hypothetical protein